MGPRKARRPGFWDKLNIHDTGDSGGEDMFGTIVPRESGGEELASACCDAVAGGIGERTRLLYSVS